MTPLSNVIIDFAREKYSDALIDEMLPLWKDHYDEIAMYTDFPLSPNLVMYKQSDDAGFLRIFTARHEGKLVGYQVFFIHNHPHYSSMRQAVQDNLFLLDKMRIGMTGYRFLKWADERLAEDGVDIIFQNVRKTAHFGRMLERLGYAEHDILYSRRVTWEPQPSHSSPSL